MNKIKPIVWKIAYDLGLIVMGIQILLGVCWLLQNLWLVPDFPQTVELLEMSETWVLDEYAGAAYVALVFVAQTLQNCLGIPFQIFLYVLQLALGIWAVYRLLRYAFADHGEVFLKEKRGKLVLASLFVNTIPFLLQAHMAVLPYSLAGSMLFALLAELLSLIRWSGNDECLGDKKGLAKKMTILIVLWCLSALIYPGHRMISGAVVVLGVLCVGIGRKELRGWLVIGVVLGALLGGLTLAVTSEEGSRNKIQNTLESQAMQRLAWPHLESMESVWPWDVVVAFSEEELGYVSVTPERVRDVFGPWMEEKFGKELANAYYGDMAVAALRYNTKAVLSQIGKDMCFYLCPQWSTLQGLEGKGVSYTGQNYERLQESTPKLTQVFVKWSGISFVVFCLMTIACWRRNKMSGLWLGLVVFAWATLVVSCTWTSGGMVDYLKSFAVMAIWGMLMTLWLWAGEERGADSK
ncbi:MAG: hypothetical protein IJW63_07295 [Lachnospiraceae bacterium]|nr:hypothetical protein [Lachnospiraceae bacterium]